MSARRFNRPGIAGIRVAGDADPGIVGQHPLEPLGGGGRPVGHDDLARMERIADPDSAAVVKRDPRGAGGCVQQRVQDRPVGNRVGSVAHPLGLPERGRDRSRIEMIAADHDRRR